MTKYNPAVDRRRFLQATGVCSAVALSGCTGSGDDETDRTTTVDGQQLTTVDFTDSWVPKGQMGPLYRALDEGMYADRGVALNVNRGYGSSSTAQAVGTGRTDIGFAGITAVASQIVEGLDNLVWISPLQPNVLASVIARPDSGIEELEDLEGLDGARQSGSVNWLVTQAVMNQEGIDVDGIDWEVADAGSELLLAGEVDFYQDWFSDTPMFWLSDESIEPTVIPYRPFTQVFGNGFVTRREFYEENREAVEGFLDAVYEAYVESLVGSDPETAEKDVDAVFRYFEEMSVGEGSEEFHHGNTQMFRDGLLDATTQEHGIGYMSEDVLESSIEFINEFLLEDDTITQEELVPDTDDRIVESGDYEVSNIEQQKEDLGEIVIPGEGTWENPLSREFL